MSFSFEFFSFPDGSGPLADVFTSLTFDTISYYVVSWLYWMTHSLWFSLLLYAALLYLAIRVILNLINAFGGSDHEPTD